MVALLLKYNVCPGLKDNTGLTAKDYASKLTKDSGLEISEMLDATDLMNPSKLLPVQGSTPTSSLAPTVGLAGPSIKLLSPSPAALMMSSSNRCEVLGEPVEMNPAENSGSKSTGKSTGEEEPDSDMLGQVVKGSGIALVRGEELTFEEVINRGSSCVVIKGKWRGTEVAIKQFRIEYRQSAKEMGKFVKELKVLASIRHPNLLLLMGLCIDMPNLCLVTEYVPNCTLFYALHKNKTRRLTLEERYKIAIQLTQSLNYLHNNDPPIVHRDLKPENCLVRAKQLDDSMNLKLADFGLARPLSCFAAEAEAQTTTCIGTTRFMAPELFEKDSASTIGVEVDVWALGCLLIELFSNKRPWDYISSANVNCVFYEIFRKKPIPIPDSIPEGLRSIIGQCCQYKPSLRMKTREVFVELEALRAEML
jgi:serine/threonine-protein kinase CTR1